MPGLNSEEAQRYSRHLMLPEMGVEGQERLKNSSVLCIGAGGLGSPMALYLAAAGVGRLGMVDFDVVELSNLQRQIIHTTSDVGRSKLTSAREKLEAINPHVKVEAHEVRLSSENALELFRDYDVIADGTDNFPTRYLVNDACILTGKPNVYGSIFRFEGQALVFRGGPATDASTRNLRLLDWFLPVLKEVCWGFSRDWSGPFRQQRSSSCFLASGVPWWAGSCFSMPSSSASAKCGCVRTQPAPSVASIQRSTS